MNIVSTFRIAFSINCISAFTSGSVLGLPFHYLFDLFARSLAPPFQRRLGAYCVVKVQADCYHLNLDAFPRNALQSHSCAAPQERSSVSVVLPGSM